MPYLKWPVQCSFSGPDSPGLALARCGGEPALSLRLLIPHTLVQETAPWAPDASSSFLEDFRFVALRPKRGCRISWLAARGARLTICVIEVGTYCVHYLLPRSLEIGKLFFFRGHQTRALTVAHLVHAPKDVMLMCASRDPEPPPLIATNGFHLAIGSCSACGTPLSLSLSLCLRWHEVERACQHRRQHRRQTSQTSRPRSQWSASSL